MDMPPSPPTSAESAVSATPASASAESRRIQPDDRRSASGTRRRPRGLSAWTVVAALAVLGVDQFTKWLAVNHLEEPVHLVWTLRLTLAFNTGTAFSLGAGWGPLIGIFAVVVVFVLVRLGRTVVTPVGLVALGMVMGGAVGNLLDRLLRESPGFLRGPVVDFIDLQWWPIFNVADMGIVLGGVLLAWTGLERRS